MLYILYDILHLDHVNTFVGVKFMSLFCHTDMHIEAILKDSYNSLAIRMGVSEYVHVTELLSFGAKLLIAAVPGFTDGGRMVLHTTCCATFYA